MSGPNTAPDPALGGRAAVRWREQLEAWAIPTEILNRAPENPWTFPVELFVSRAEAAGGHLSYSNRAALIDLPERGTVLDVGCGAGGASMALAERASLLIGVDSSPEMLHAFEGQAERAGVAAQTLEGRWPDVASQAPVADVAVCHHVAYNAPDLDAFATSLTRHARARVVMELTVGHPQSRLNELWLRFHGVVRPTGPTAMDAVAVLREAGLDARWQQWEEPRPGGFAHREDLTGWVRRQLCLPVDRQSEVDRACAGWVVERDGLFGFPDRPVITLWWDGQGS